MRALFKNRAPAFQADQHQHQHQNQRPPLQPQLAPPSRKMTASLLNTLRLSRSSSHSSKSRSPSPATRRPSSPGQAVPPPPPYTPPVKSAAPAAPADPAANASSQPIPTITNTSTSGITAAAVLASDLEERCSALADFDTVFLIDDSGSMAGGNWNQTSAALSAIVRICTKYDTDGVDIQFLNHPTEYENVHDADEVLQIFDRIRPMGTTPTGKKLGRILETYLHKFRRTVGDIKPLNIICITDGEPTDPGLLENNIINAARELDRLQAPDRQVGIQFFQVGSDEAATYALDDLDNALNEEHGVRDMVDTVSWKKMNAGRGLSADGILKVVLGAVDKKFDRQRRVN